MNKPRAVGIAVYLMILTLLLGMVVLALDYDYMVALAPAAGVLGAVAISVLISGLLIWKISQGRNWARIVMLVFFIFGCFSAYNIIMQSLERSVLLGGLQVLQQACQLVALVLLFIPPGSEYFRKPEAGDPAPTAG